MLKILFALLLVLTALASLDATMAAAQSVSAETCKMENDRCRGACNGSIRPGSCIGGCQSRYSQCLGRAVDGQAHFSVHGGGSNRYNGVPPSRH